MENLFVTSVESIYRVLILGVLTYALVVVTLRLSGKRTLSKLNAFDFVVTIALGSALASGILNKQTGFAESGLAILLLVGLQALVSRLAARYKPVDRAVKSRPTVLLIQGKVVGSKALSERVSFDEICAAVRAAGHASLENVGAVVLETDGTLSVIVDGDPVAGSAMPSWN